MQILLKGFGQSANFRLYTFQGATSAREFTVGVDLNLARQYAVSLQELPLLLEGQPALGEVYSLTFSEEEMLGIADWRAEAQREAEQKSKNRRRPPSSKVGQTWVVDNSSPPDRAQPKPEPAVRVPETNSSVCHAEPSSKKREERLDRYAVLQYKNFTAEHP